MLLSCEFNVDRNVYFFTDQNAACLKNSVISETKVFAVELCRCSATKPHPAHGIFDRYHLKGPDFFDVAKFPTMTFKSKKIEAIGEGKFKVTGDLTMHGVTKEVVLDVEGTTTRTVETMR